jgi:saccharopine dehydrogenase-like NADP-dependent oxidoreductase
MAKVWALGCGLVGEFVIRKLLAAGHEVGIVDLSIPSELISHQGTDSRIGDVFEILDEIIEEQNHNTGTDSNCGNRDVSLFINLLPGGIGSKVRHILLKQGNTVIDLAFTEQNPSIEEDTAIANGGRLIWDIGIAPGFSNLLLAHAQRQFGHLAKGTVKVGGNPQNPDGEWSYMAPFSPADVIAEYTRPARIISGGKVTEVPAITDKHRIQVGERGEMEAFLTDGLRSLLTTISANELLEYTVRWPGHIDRFVSLRDSGGLDEDKLLQEWKMKAEIPEFTWMEVIATSLGGDTLRWTIEDEGGDDGSSMARATGLVTTCCALMFIEKPTLLPPGVHPPEALPAHDARTIMEYLKQNGVHITGPAIQ